VPDEPVTTFSCRLENLLQLAEEHGKMEPKAKNDLLCHKFWTSLASDKLKGQTRHKYDSISNYDELLREIRSVEKELKVSSSTQSKKATANPVVVDSQSVDLEKKYDSKFQDLEKRLDSKIDDKFSQILAKLDTFPSNENHYPQNTSYRGQNNNRFGRRPYFGGNRNNRGRGGRYNNQKNGNGKQGQQSLNP